MSKSHRTQDSPEPLVLYAGGCSVVFLSDSDTASPSGGIFADPSQHQIKKKKKKQKSKSRRQQESVPSQSAVTMAEASSSSISLEKNSPAPRGLLFCPFRLVRQYPDKYVGNMNRQKVHDFFKENLFKGEGWNMFYLYDPCSSRAPLLFVPSTDFEEFLRVVNRELRTLLTIPNGANSAKLKLGFEGCLRPLFAGKVETQDAYYALQTKLAQSNSDDPNTQPAALSYFKAEMDKIYESVKTPKFKKDPAIQRAKMIAKQKSFGQITKRVQRYLGLRTRAAYTSGEADKKWDTSLPPPFKTEWDVRFVCIDVEAHELNNKNITEIGIAILDTQDIVGLSSGLNGSEWFSKIQAHHLRIKEVAHLINHRFVKGCPAFFDFGESEFVPGMNIAKRIESIIGTYDTASPIVLVGHDVTSDLKYLMDLGINLWRSPLFLDEVDTQSMFQRVQRDPKHRKLAVMCNELGIPGRNFHNAGNDAMYTLRAMITMAVLRTTGYPEIFSTTENPREIPSEAEWTDGEDEDGGSCIRSQEPRDSRQAPSASNSEPLW